MDAALARQVWHRAGHCCEYCRMPQDCDDAPFEIDHIIARKHRGATVAENLARTCALCNRRHGPNLAGIDPKTRTIVRLFHPRRHSWRRHFDWDGPFLVGRTAIGRATVEVLAINLPLRVRHRAQVMAEGTWPAVEGR